MESSLYYLVLSAQYKYHSTLYHYVTGQVAGQYKLKSFYFILLGHIICLVIWA